MDLEITKKETVLQPQGFTDVLVDSVFDFIPIVDSDNPNLIVDFNAVIDNKELQQAGLYAILRQRGADPLAIERGVRWSEAYLGEIPGEAIVTDINIESRRVSSAVTVELNTYVDENNETYLDLQVNVVP